MTGLRGLGARIRDLLQSGATVDPGIPLQKIPFVVVDTELTGLDPRRDAIVSVGAVKMSGSRIEVGRTYYRLVKPRAALRHESIIIHGITPDEVAAEPASGDVTAEFREFCGDRVLVGHFVTLDLRFLAREAYLPGGAARHAIDTFAIDAWLRERRNRGGIPVAEEGRQRTLVALAHRRGIRVDGAHNAFRDAYITAQLLQRQLREMPGIGVRTLGDLLRVGRP